MLTARRPQGFTLIELMVTISFAAVLLMMGAPSMSAYLQNSKLSSTTQTLYSALQTARTESIRRNVSAEFLLTSAAVTAPGVQNSAVPDANGRNWLVRAPDPAASAVVLIDAKSSAEGQPSAGASSVAITAVANPTTFSGSVRFTGLGATADGSTYTFDISNPDGGLCAPAGPMRCKRIRVAAGGQVSICDPAAAATDNRRCQP